MNLLVETILFVLCTILGAAWWDEWLRHRSTKGKLAAALGSAFPEFDVAPEDHA